MISAIINGCNGKMGQILALEIDNDNDIEVCAGIDRSPNKKSNSFKVYSDIFAYKDEANVVIDFSNPYFIPGLLDYCLEKNLPIIIATTGLSSQDLKDIKRTSQKIPVFFSANMSLGINIITKLARKASNILKDSFDIEIIEKYHAQKIDSPSGTTYMIANNINEELDNSMVYNFGRYSKDEKRASNEIGIHSVRGGTIVGEHSIIFAGTNEIIEIKHSAASRNIFALGAIQAAKFIVNKKNGLYTMDDLLNF